MKITFNHIEGSRKGSSQQFDSPQISIGRDPMSTIAFDPHKDDRVSTKHAEIAERGGHVTITDLGSRNGTFVNGQRIVGSVPLAPGALVQFGDGGPQVMVTFDAPGPPPVPTPPMPKKGGGGAACVVIAILGFLFLAVAAVVVFFLFFRVAASGGPSPVAGMSPIAVGSATPAASPAAPVASPAAPVASPAAPVASPAAPAPSPAAPAASPSPAGVTIYESPWKKLGVGSSFESESTTHMANMPDTKMGICQTLTGKTDDEATLKMETLMTGMTLPPSESKVKLRMEVPAAASDVKVEKKDESVTVPAGTFACHYTKTDSTANGTHTVTEVWMCDDLPVAVKSKTTMDGGTSMTSESVLVKADKK